MAAYDPHTIHLSIRGPIDRSRLPSLLGGMTALLEQRQPRAAFCDVADACVDAVTIDALAQLRLAAQRRGCELLLLNVSIELRGLLALTGLDEVLGEAHAAP